MTKRALTDFFPSGFPVLVNDIEIKNKQTIPTYFLMKKFEELYGADYEFHFIMGSDLIPTLHLWHEPEKLVSDINFIIYNRLNGDPSINLELTTPSGMPKKFLYKSGARNFFGEISSTEVRRRIDESRVNQEPKEKQMNIPSMVTKSVIDFIFEKNLY